MIDVIVVGAGFSGLIAARKIRTSYPDASVLVLEARDRVGGRMFAREAGDERKGWVDHGGQWLGEDHPCIRTLASDLGLEIFEQHTDGLDVVRFDGGRYLDDSDTAAPNAKDRDAAEELLEALERTADLVVPDASRAWAGPRAAEFDRITIAEWLASTSDNEYARFYVGNLVTFDQPGGALREVSLLHSLFETKANPYKGEPDKYYLRGAAGQIPPLLAAQLGGDEVVRTGSRVVAIHQSGDGVTVTAISSRGLEEHAAKAVIVATPPWLAGTISYSSSVPGQPDLPARRLQLTQRMAMGTIAKIACVYDTPWWRTSGEELSGTSFSHGRLVGQTADSGLPGDEGPGVMVGFVQGDLLLEWIGLPPDGRKQWITRELVDIFGADAGQPLDYVEALWPQDQLTGGGYNAYLPPGGWTAYGSAIREPFGRISWAGTETATQWFGYFEGAATAGERAADEVLQKWL